MLLLSVFVSSTSVLLQELAAQLKDYGLSLKSSLMAEKRLAKSKQLAMGPPCQPFSQMRSSRQPTSASSWITSHAEMGDMSAAELKDDPALEQPRVPAEKEIPEVGSDTAESMPSLRSTDSE